MITVNRSGEGRWCGPRLNTRFPIIENVRGAVFFDRGVLNRDPHTFGGAGQHIVSDVGIGVRLDLPIGPIRIDYGIPIQRDGNHNDGRFNFNVGYQF